MTDLAAKYKIPSDMVAFVEKPFLEVAENETTTAVEFNVLSKRSTDLLGRKTTYTIYWIHHDFNSTGKRTTVG